jgi:hypothetical protein
VRRDAGVVDQHVEPAERFAYLGEQRRDLVLAGEVGRQRERLAAVLPDAGRDLVEEGGAPCHQHGAGTFGREAGPACAHGLRNS